MTELYIWQSLGYFSPWPSPHAPPPPPPPHPESPGNGQEGNSRGELTEGQMAGGWGGGGEVACSLFGRVSDILTPRLDFYYY